ncbi:uncharacterized protein LOC114875905 isoform X2 [Osmia bicornis bicornis]|uniref:uncharacterized protein LOC114875905 isoform X2 n=1 Tax=Osmia bicornis bicornis TaxID=1437191 RepID=UPI0010FA25F4|nr:uncharacterized protein LOC114875905 isoform X2 [Osmia bicornis bicornis]
MKAQLTRCIHEISRNLDFRERESMSLSKADRTSPGSKSQHNFSEKIGHEQEDRGDTGEHVSIGRREERDRHDDRSCSGVKRIVQFQRNVPTRPGSRSIPICWRKDGTRYAALLLANQTT